MVEPIAKTSLTLYTGGDARLIEYNNPSVIDIKV